MFINPPTSTLTPTPSQWVRLSQGKSKGETYADDDANDDDNKMIIMIMIIKIIMIMKKKI